MLLPIQGVNGTEGSENDDDEHCGGDSDEHITSNHWGQGALETSGNILGKLQALDHFPPNVSTNHIWGTFGM